MKKSLLLFSIALIAIFYFGCEEDAPVKKSCETNNTGTLTLKNTKSTTIYVKVGTSTQNISSGSTGTFSSVNAGTCSCDITWDGTTYQGVQFSTCVTQCNTTALQY